MSVSIAKSSTLVVIMNLLLAFASGGAAQRSPPDLTQRPIEDLMNITVTTAARDAQRLADAPARVDVVTAAQIRRRGYRSLAEVLRDLPDFKVDISADPDYPTELTVQGVRGSSRLIVLLDGIRVVSPTNEPLPILANYPVHHARQIEIIYGPASALYGADAFSGVINIVTNDPDEAPGLAASTSIGQYGLYNHTASYGKRWGGASLAIAGQWFADGQPNLSRFYPDDFGQLEAQRTNVFQTVFGPMSSDDPVPPDYEIPMSAHSLHATFRAGGFRLFFFRNRGRVPTAAAYTPDHTVYSPSVFKLNTLTVAAAAYQRGFGPVTSTSTLTASRHELDPQSGYWNVYTNMQKAYKYAYGTMFKLDEQLSWKPAASTRVITGATVERFFAIPETADLEAPIVTRATPGFLLGTNIPDHFNRLRYANAGVFGQVEHGLSPYVTVTLGARSDYNTRYGGTFNPRVGVVANPRINTTVKLLYGTAFLAPTPYQAYGHYGSFYTTDGGATYASDYWHLGNRDLLPQHKQTIEGQLVQVLRPDLVLSASVFRSRFADLIKEVDPERAYTGSFHGWPVAHIDVSANEGSALVFGGSVALDVAKSFGGDRRLAARAAVGLADGHVSDEHGTGGRVPIGAMAPRQAHFSSDLDWDRWSIAPRLLVSSRQRLLATMPSGSGVVRRTLDGYSRLDLTVRRREIVRHVDAFVMIENALDGRYRTVNHRAYTHPEEMIGSPQNPRRVTVGFDFRFQGF